MTIQWPHVLAATLLGVSACAPGVPVHRPTLSADATVLALQDTLAAFEGARAIDVAPDGRVYVVDSGADQLVVIDGLIRRSEGGPGTEDLQFDEPLDVDATTGLVIWVADAGNHRLKRFSREFRYLGSVVVDLQSFLSEVVGRAAAGRTAGAAAAGGEPVGVVTSAADELFAIEGREGVVLKWDASLRPERVIGGFGSGEGELVHPVAMASDRQRYLYVADRGRQEVVVFDLLGTFVRSMGRAAGTDPVSVSVDAQGRVLVVHSDAVFVYSREGVLLDVLSVEHVDPLVAVAPLPDALLLLTSRHLLRAAYRPSR